ncbi:precorrin-2 dehydrogenase/sirohydrochlorin ferrochelatase [Kwoniella mangroviensis CBS 10435]|uniref:precorrin-2 dehydrogenase n=1 Tax=Kwoniella mangroviensis CBS 10435 TaxID=1331196 RepID=A0A1B9ILD7_9TREE|nr:precorrin-2 dehydrogenase/sirohydrochlorin ferrochelatase [Kwoniella mangroviensis CBS 8507]OCF56382.1 precorrin-2 dehydrogenase/sirohydrochlorin ferrochelatase [Kwoniella mangroviensis CBS 10435]OCF62967.1 precorrin-2 dehydrogenase/sirohydrochlorin ferrochelatase [Kwoniella mangroviensis CBS 8507]OCF79132.1 precorrin-2 dehydrogenase/sirohydrochlorin ferrochelatase [Kwoniella mangroviensis CBS 8886]
MSSEVNANAKPPSRDSSEESYPPIIPGASLLLALRLANRPILLVGGGVVASQRLYFLLESDAHITIISPGPLHPSIQHRINDPTTSSKITWLDRPYLGRKDEIKVKDYDLVMTAIDDNDLSRETCELCREEKVMVNVADIPPQCDFYFGAQLRKGPLQILISTGGLGPRSGAMIRDLILENLPSNIEDSIKGIGSLRADLRKRAPGVGGKLGQERMDWMKEVSDTWGLDLMKRFNDEELRKEILDKGWESRKILGPDDLGGKSSSWTQAIQRTLGTIDWTAGIGGFGLGVAFTSLGLIILQRQGRL